MDRKPVGCRAQFKLACAGSACARSTSSSVLADYCASVGEVGYLETVSRLIEIATRTLFSYGFDIALLLERPSAGIGHPDLRSVHTNPAHPDLRPPDSQPSMRV